MIKWGLIPKEQDKIQKIKIDEIIYTKAKDEKFLTRLFESNTYLTFYVIFTIYALFGDDFRQLTVSVKYDYFFYFLMSLTCLFFLSDIILSSLYSKLYRFSVLFIMDVVSVCFLLFDIGPLNQLFFQKMSMNVYGVLARGARAVLIGYPIYRKIKNFQNVYKKSNLKDLPKQYQQDIKDQKIKQKQKNNIYQIQKESQQNIDNFMKKPKNSVMIDSDFVKQEILNSKIDKKKFKKSQKQLKKDLKEDSSFQQVFEQVQNTSHQLTNRFQMKIIVGMFVLIYLLPIFWTHTYFQQLSSYSIGIMHLSIYIDNFQLNEKFNQLWQQYIDLQSDTSDHYEFIKLELFIKKSNGDFEIIKQDGDLKDYEQIKEDYRYYELEIFANKKQSQVLVGQHFVRSIWQKKKKVNLDSQLSILRTLFFLISIITLGILMSKDIQIYFTDPFYNLMSQVKMIYDNPLDAWNKIRDDSYKPVQTKKQTEIEKLRKSLIDCSKLLQIGLGEAGNEVVIQNLKFGAIFNNSETSLKNVFQGRKIYSIFGFIYINQFQEQTTKLTTKIFKFVNSIANIVHKNVHQQNGKINKNIGEAFLVVWKIDDYNSQIINEIKDFTQKDNQKQNHDAEKQAKNAVYSFIKIILEFSIKNPCKEFNRKKDMQQIDNKLSLGLHQGWAIEGAIGSQHKIDVSYLSPHVNLASRVTAATVQYGVPLLISHFVIDLMPFEFHQFFRKIDHVNLKGSKTGILLYAIDLDLSNKTISQNSDFLTWSILELEFKDFLQSETFLKLRKKFSLQFFKQWQKGFDNYQNGNWNKAKINFEFCLNENQDDSPSKNLLKFLHENNFEAYQNWTGIRSLTKK